MSGSKDAGGKREGSPAAKQLEDQLNEYRARHNQTAGAANGRRGSSSPHHHRRRRSSGSERRRVRGDGGVGRSNESEAGARRRQEAEDEALARRLQMEEQRAGLPAVRAPDQPRTETLLPAGGGGVDDPDDPMLMLMRQLFQPIGAPARAARRPGAAPGQRQQQLQQQQQQPPHQRMGQHGQMRGGNGTATTSRSFQGMSGPRQQQQQHQQRQRQQQQQTGRASQGDDSSEGSRSPNRRRRRRAPRSASPAADPMMMMMMNMHNSLVMGLAGPPPEGPANGAREQRQHPQAVMQGGPDGLMQMLGMLMGAGRPMTYEEMLELQERLQPVSRGAEQKVIDKLPIVTFKKGIVPDDEAACAVCLEDFADGEKLRKLPCNHYYHSECVDKWLVRNKTCPQCKREIDEGEEKPAEPQQQQQSSGGSEEGARRRSRGGGLFGMLFGDRR